MMRAALLALAAVFTRSFVLNSAAAVRRRSDVRMQVTPAHPTLPQEFFATERQAWLSTSMVMKALMNNAFNNPEIDGDEQYASHV